MRSLLSFISLVVIATTATTTNAHAYIDPVTGSFVVQGIAAAIAGIMVAFRSVRQKVFALLGRRARPDGTSRHDT